MTPCYLCGGREAESVLDKGPVEVWNDLGGPESLRLSHPCVVRQCRNCGHVYQPVDEALRALFDQLYRSRAAQGPSAMGLGAWGRERADALFFREIDVSRHRSAIEIGCGDGYLLRQLKDLGLTALTGIEPSSNTDRADPDGITFINAFVDEHLQMAAPVDLIYSVAVFEHIENINGVLAFCRNNLKPDGELFFVVPNGQRQLERADPALFVHQHVHHFTEHSVRRLLSAHGFSLNTLAHRDDVLCVSASLSGDPTVPSSSLGPRYDQYQPRLDAVLSRVAERLSSERVLVHGACNALNNIVGWVGGDFDLADNDENRQGHVYFGRPVLAPESIDITAYDTVIIVPMAYFAPIRAQYVALGFPGRIEGISTL
jgi:SAM-dependent methyltransferase